MDKIIFDENKFMDLFNGADFEYWYELSEELDYLFDNSGEYQQYIISGVVDLGYNGIKRYGYKDEVYNSIKDAILGAIENYDCHFTVYEKPYGRLFIGISHHDGYNVFEIREVTTRGEELINNYWDIGELLERAYTTRNAKYLKKYSIL